MLNHLVFKSIHMLPGQGGLWTVCARAESIRPSVVIFAPHCSDKIILGAQVEAKKVPIIP